MPLNAPRPKGIIHRVYKRCTNVQDNKIVTQGNRITKLGGKEMRTRTELLKARQEQCEWKQTQGCPITEFEKCSKCKAIHTKPLGLASLLEGGWEGIQKKQKGIK